MGRVTWLVGGAFAAAACLCRWEPPRAAAALTLLQVCASLSFGKLPLVNPRLARQGFLDSPFSWGAAQFGFLLATYLWDRQFGFEGGEATWTVSIAVLLLYYALARIGCLQAKCCRVPGLRFDSRWVEIGVSLAAVGLLAWSAQSSALSLLLKYLALASLVVIRLWFLAVTRQWKQMKLETLGFALTAVAFVVRDYAEQVQQA